MNFLSFILEIRFKWGLAMITGGVIAWAMGGSTWIYPIYIGITLLVLGTVLPIFYRKK